MVCLIEVREGVSRNHANTGNLQVLGSGLCGLDRSKWLLVAFLGV